MTTTASGSQVEVTKILAATDFSPESQNALAYARMLASLWRAHLYVTHVLRPETWELASAEMISPFDELRRAAVEQLHQIDRQLASVPHTVLLGQGGLWTVLERTIAEREIDFIVTGSGGGSRLGHLLLGSSAEEILRKAPCPVLTVGPSVAPLTSPGDDLQRIVFATDLRGTHAAGWALAMARKCRSRLSVLHVAGEDGAVLDRAAAARLENAMRELIPVDAGLVIPPEFVVDRGEAAARIVSFCKQRQADLVVLGLHEAGRFASHANRAIAHQVLVQSTCPVLTVR